MQLNRLVRFTAIAGLAAAAPALADDLARWNVSAYQPANNGGAVTPLEAFSTAPNVMATPITAGPGVNSLDPCGGPLSLTACAGLADMWVQYFSPQLDPADYFEFAITAAPGHAIRYQLLRIPMGVLYVVDRSSPGAPRSTGPKSWELRYSTDGFATPGTTLWTGQPFPFSIQGLPGQTVGASEEVHLSMSITPIGTRSGTITFRFYGFNPETEHPTGPQGFGAGPTNRTYFGWPRFDATVVGTVEAAPCYANCDSSTAAPVLNVDDFTCFINNYAAASSLPHAQQASHYANCDGSMIAPALNVDDFTCFINAYASACP